jgi:Rps23 Pro-64 3,4-dihydroxylase Tpa1-like proline 4-hydroxylase
MNQELFNEDGLCIVDNFLPVNIVNKLYQLYESYAEDEWSYQDQIREGHYKHVFKTNNQFLPKGNEQYRAKFWRSEAIENSPEFKKIFNQYFKNQVQALGLLDGNLKEFDVRAYRLNQGDYYRTHIDSYAGSINFIFYLNKEWIWDWGGILHICSDKDENYCRPIFPKFNRLVLLNNKKFHSPHFISPVSEFALCKRYSVVVFAS